jgi:hypothetical protein
MWSCNTLDIPNLSSYDANSVWNDENLSSAYLTNLYPAVFTNWDTGNGADQNSEQTSGMPFYANVVTETTGDGYKKWHYTNIRNLNEAIVQMAAGSLPEQVKTSLTAQALFLRASLYFDMVMHHGGMPIIETPQTIGVDDLDVARNSTAECFDFILKDIDTAIAGLPARIASGSADYGRIDQTYAKAFKAKVLLYKASPLFNPANPYSNPRWTEAYAAAKEAYDFAVANGAALTPSYDDIFLVEGGAEVLMAVVNQYPNKTEAWSNYLRPQSLTIGQISRGPTWDMLMSFPMADGKAWDDPTGKYYVATEDEFMQSFWKNRDPRFYSSVLCPGQEFPVAGTNPGYRQYTSVGIAVQADAYGINPDAGATSIKNDAFTGFYVRKAIDLSVTADLTDRGSLDRPVMRLAELMFIYAEAANETGHSDMTVQLLKGLRERAGIEPGDDGNFGLPASPSIEELRELILYDRNIELCFEGHRFYDLRRTRKMMEHLEGLQKYGLESIAINPDGTDMPIAEAQEKARTYQLTTDDFRYVKQRVPYTPAAENTFVVTEGFYFFPIQKVKLDENPNLQQNNTWGGTFNPTLE